jgi:hypothetical protein
MSFFFDLSGSINLGLDTSVFLMTMGWNYSYGYTYNL